MAPDSEVLFDYRLLITVLSSHVRHSGQFDR